MSTEVTWQTGSTGSNETEQIAEQIGRNIRGSEVIELVSDLGGGKTTFVRGLAKGMGSLDSVASPTYTISRQYHTQDLTLHHFDFYRLSEPGVMQHELQEAIHDHAGVVVIEWANIVQGVLPKERLTIHLKTTGETTRSLSLVCPKSYKYLLAGVQ